MQIAWRSISWQLSMNNMRADIGSISINRIALRIDGPQQLEANLAKTLVEPSCASVERYGCIWRRLHGGIVASRADAVKPGETGAANR
jgi:hypothetical protein